MLPPFRPSALLLLAAILTSPGVAAQEPLTVPLGDPAYRTLAAASGEGLLREHRVRGIGGPPAR